MLNGLQTKLRRFNEPLELDKSMTRWFDDSMEGHISILLTFCNWIVIVWIEIRSNVWNRWSWPWFIIIKITFGISDCTHSTAAAVFIRIRHRWRGFLSVRPASIDFVCITPTIAHICGASRCVRFVRHYRWSATIHRRRCHRGCHRITIVADCWLRGSNRRHIWCVTVHWKRAQAWMLWVAVV